MRMDAAGAVAAAVAVSAARTLCRRCCCCWAKPTEVLLLVFRGDIKLLIMFTRL
jgi:hypothetical protein